ncbi:MAG: spore maturation protein [Clostridia bacterium]|nr:spore maturation protein [Clostridia bacterium]
MVNLIWLFLLLTGILVAGINGNVEVVTKASLEAAKNSVQIAIELVGIMALWLGIMRVAEKAGIIRLIAYFLRPVTGFLFPSVPKDHPAMASIVMNISANMLGLGNAATPLGLKAMKELQHLNDNKDTASDAMCTFLALNTSCITLIPATIIGVRAAAGSLDPTSIVGTTIFATVCATTAAVVSDRLFRAQWYGKNRGRTP